MLSQIPGGLQALCADFPGTICMVCPPIAPAVWLLMSVVISGKKQQQKLRPLGEGALDKRQSGERAQVPASFLISRQASK